MSGKKELEELKKSSDGLRGTLARSLNEPTGLFDDNELQLIKFHGMYQQDDRDLRQARRAEGLDKAYSLMIRCTIPGGRLTGRQYLELDRIADEYANGTLRITTRQSIQFHGILKSNIKQTIADINRQLITTLAACGDVQRNVMASIAPVERPIFRQIGELTRRLAAELLPRTRAYSEIWLDGEKVPLQDEIDGARESDADDFYGETWLPRKFKTGIAIAGENGIDVYSYDAGLIAIPDEHENLAGFNVLAGGGLGMSHGRANTFAQLATEIGFVGPGDGIAAMRIIGTIYRDHGNRDDRKQARLKYLIDSKGAEWFCNEFRNRATFPVHPPRRTAREIDYDDFLGKREQRKGLFSYGVFVQSGRIVDKPPSRMRSALRSIVQRLNPGIILTPQQSLLLTGLDEEGVSQVESILAEHGVPLVADLSGIQRYSMACPAMPTCGLAVAESERAVEGVIAEFRGLLEELELQQERVSLRMTGCPNGCARPYTADIALVGRRPGVYHLFVGGRLAGDRMADLFAGDVAIEEVVPTLRPLIKAWGAHRLPGEGLGDFYQRILGRGEPRQRLTGKEEPTLPLVQLQLSRETRHAG